MLVKVGPGGHLTEGFGKTNTPVNVLKHFKASLNMLPTKYISFDMIYIDLMLIIGITWIVYCYQGNENMEQ